MNLLAELKRRKVFKVGGAYLVVAALACDAAIPELLRGARQACHTSMDAPWETDQ